MIGKKFKDTWTDEIVEITEITSEANYYKFENENYSVYYWIGERFIEI